MGDGSGTTWEHGCGWSSVLIDHYSNYRVEFHGNWNRGTSHIAEMMPYLQALTWYLAGPGSAKVGKKIHMITDNANVANCGNRVAERSTYGWLWASFVHIEQMGHILQWHWIGRNRLALNKLVDYMAGLSRRSVDPIKATVEEKAGCTMEDLLYDYNPTENIHARLSSDVEPGDHPAATCHPVDDHPSGSQG